MAATPLRTVGATRACATCFMFRPKSSWPPWTVCGTLSRYSSSPTATQVGCASWRKPTPGATHASIARNGRPDPVVGALPRDMPDETADILRVDFYPVIHANPEPALIQTGEIRQ